MPGDGYTAQPGDLQANAPKYDAVAQQVDQIRRTLSDGLEGLGACWGSDDQGQTFAAKYCPPAVSLIHQMSATDEGLQSIVDGICSWAQNFVSVENGAVQAIQQWAQGL